jgi:hypothetical protein
VQVNDNANSCSNTPAARAGRIFRRLGIPLLLTVCCLCSPDLLHAQSARIIVNSEVGSVPLDRDLLRAIFTMRLRSWPNGPPVRVFILPDDNPLSDRFYREQLGMYSYVLRAAWDRMVFTGTGLAPTIVRSEEEMRERVRLTPGAIGYVSKPEDAASSRWFPLLRTASTQVHR